MSGAGNAGFTLSSAHWPEVEAGPRRLLVVPVGSLEQHGAHLPLDTDFPGTLSIGSVALTTVLVELGRHASLHWPAMLLVNGHGGNVTAIRDAVRALRREGRRSHVWHAGLRPGMLASQDGMTPDAHAGRVETSMMLALAPDDVRLDAAAAGDTRPLTEILPDLSARGVREVSPNGVLGDPAGASAAEGQRLLAHLADDLTAAMDRFLAGLPA